MIINHFPFGLGFLKVMSELYYFILAIWTPLKFDFEQKSISKDVFGSLEIFAQNHIFSSPSQPYLTSAVSHHTYKPLDCRCYPPLCQRLRGSRRSEDKKHSEAAALVTLQLLLTVCLPPPCCFVFIRGRRWRGRSRKKFQTNKVPTVPSGYLIPGFSFQ